MTNGEIYDNRQRLIQKLLRKYFQSLDLRIKKHGYGPQNTYGLWLSNQRIPLDELATGSSQNHAPSISLHLSFASLVPLHPMVIMMTRRMRGSI